MSTHVAGDLSELPESGGDSRVLTFWGTLAFIVLEGMGFLLTYGIFLYVAWLHPEWPLGYPPQNPTWATIFTVILVVSLVPNWMVMKACHKHDNRALQWLLVLMSLIGIATLVVRWFEFQSLSIHWDTNAYGSMLWVFLGLHTLHLITDVVDTLVMTAIFFTGHVPLKRFNDADENALYWVFVVVAWLPLYGLLYFTPYLGGG